MRAQAGRRWITESAAALLCCLMACTTAHRCAASPVMLPPLDRDEIAAALFRAADWQLATPNDQAVHVWRMSPFYDGLVRLSDITGDAHYLAPVMRFAGQGGWQPGPATYDADDHAVCHAWMDIFLSNPVATRRFSKIKERFDHILSHPIVEDIQFGLSPPPGRTARDRWTWCDALYMAPPTLARLYTATGDRRYLDFLESEWKFTHDKLWDSSEQLYYRDNTFLQQRTPSGRKILWGRGNGWVLGGLALTLDHIPKNHSSRAYLENIFLEMSQAVMRAQQPDGLWRTNLADPGQFAVGETSASGFFIFGLAWGINNGLLDRAKTWPAVERGWRGLMTRIENSGRVGYVQPVGAAPTVVNASMSYEYGTGAFLLAGSEILRALGARPPKTPATLLAEAEKLLVSESASHAQAFLLPEAGGDIAWENDCVAFRIRGPAHPKTGHGAGIEIGLKTDANPLIESWYAGELCCGGSFRENKDSGFDIYNIGDSLGCGGLALWRDNRPVNAGAYKRVYVNWTAPDIARVTLFYEYPPKDGKVIRETRIITLRRGEQTFDVTSRFTIAGQKPAAASGLDVVAGLVVRSQATQVWFDPGKTLMAAWDAFDVHAVGTTAVFAPGSVSRMEIHPHNGAPKNAQQALAILKTDAKGEVRYRAGFAWTRSGAARDFDSWKQFSGALSVGGPPPNMPAPAVTRQWIDLATTYVIHAETLWHNMETGGCWGDGLNDSNANGAVRAICNTMLAYAFIVHTMDSGWLSQGERERLERASLDRARLLARIDASLRSICAHHVAAPNPRKPGWGNTWQSSLWFGSVGTAVLLTWRDIDDSLKRAFAGISASEADRIAAKPPYDLRPGDSGAEENGWDTLALAVALALDPQSPRAATWERALQCYAANVYSVPADATDTSLVGTDRVRDIVRTQNILPDYTLVNHKIFHPDYIQVSGLELGQALAILELADRLHGTKLAAAFRPYALHNALNVWKNVMHPLLLPDGDFAFPSGQDWTLHSSMSSGYLAYVSTLLGDPDAALAERLHPLHAARRRELSPRGRILGDSNLDWWWEPLLVKRGVMAVLQHELRDSPGATLPSASLRFAATRLFPDSKIWLHRNNYYFISISWGARSMVTFTPFDRCSTENPYMTYPLPLGLLSGMTGVSVDSSEDNTYHCVTITTKDGSECAIAVLPESVVILSPGGVAPLAIQNDPLSGGLRTLHAQGGTVTIPFSPAAEGNIPRKIGSSWINIDDRLGMITSGGGFLYTQAKGFNARSLAYDKIIPEGRENVTWQLIPGVDRARTERMAADFSPPGGGVSATVSDRSGQQFRIYRPDAKSGARIERISRQPGK